MKYIFSEEDMKINNIPAPQRDYKITDLLILNPEYLSFEKCEAKYQLVRCCMNTSYDPCDKILVICCIDGNFGTIDRKMILGQPTFDSLVKWNELYGEKSYARELAINRYRERYDTETIQELYVKTKKGERERGYDIAFMWDDKKQQFV